MALPTNGTARRALITGAIGLAFAAGGWWADRVEKRLSWCESEQFRIGKIAAGRGEMIQELKQETRELRRDVSDLQKHHAVIEYRAGERRLH